MQKQDFIPDYQLDSVDKANLSQLLVTPGYQVLLRVGKSEVDKFVVELINADPAKPEEVLSRQLLAKAAAVFYTSFMQRLANEGFDYVHSPRKSDKPVDDTEEVLDLGEIVANLPEGETNFFE